MALWLTGTSMATLCNWAGYCSEEADDEADSAQRETEKSPDRPLGGRRVTVGGRSGHGTCHDKRERPRCHVSHPDAAAQRYW